MPDLAVGDFALARYAACNGHQAAQRSNGGRRLKSDKYEFRLEPALKIVTGELAAAREPSSAEDSFVHDGRQAAIHCDTKTTAPPNSANPMQ